MPREVILYNPEQRWLPSRRNGYTIKLKYEALRRASLKRANAGRGQPLNYEIHKFKSRGELEQQIRDAFLSHQTNPIDKLVIDVHGSIIGNPGSRPEGRIKIKPYSGDLIAQIQHGNQVHDYVTATELSAILRRIRPQNRIPQLRLICCNSGLLSVENNIARTFLRSNLFNYVVAEDMTTSVYLNENNFRTRMSFREAVDYYSPFVNYTPVQNQPESSTRTFLNYCAPGNGFRDTEGTVVFYHYLDPVYNRPIERYERYTPTNLPPSLNFSRHPGRTFPPYV